MVAFVIDLLNCVSIVKTGAQLPTKGVLTSSMSLLIFDMLWYPEMGRSGSSLFRRRVLRLRLTKGLLLIVDRAVDRSQVVD